MNRRRYIPFADLENVARDKSRSGSVPAVEDSASEGPYGRQSLKFTDSAQTGSPDFTNVLADESEGANANGHALSSRMGGVISPRTRDRLVKRLQQQGIQSQLVLEAMRLVPRHLFMDEALSYRAYEDTALPIGYGQTISQPYVVARMTELLTEKLPAGERFNNVLEVGTGSGYQAAVLSSLSEKVHTVERIRALFRRTRLLFKQLDIRNVQCSLSDGTWGSEEHAPYDAILVTAAPVEVPPALLEQLAVGGRLVIPLGDTSEVQQLVVIDKTDSGYEKKTLEPVSFVPFLPDVS